MDQNRVAEIADLPLPKFLLKEYLQEESAQMHGSESVTCESVLKSVGFIKECRYVYEFNELFIAELIARVGERAWYTLFARVPKLSNSTVCIKRTS